MRRRLSRWLPSPQAVQSHRSLRWLGPLLRRPWLWHLDRRRVARGAAIGVFFGLMVPIAQIVLSAIFALLLRANLPVAAFATLVSNPFTYAPIFLLAYKTGAAILGEPAYPSEVEAIEEARDPQDWFERVRGIGKPLFIGLAIFALVGGTATWCTVTLLWVLYVRIKRRRRRTRRPDRQ